MKLIDETGNRHGRLVVLERAPGPFKRTCAYWICRCDCGNEIVTAGESLRGGNTQSCGCLSIEISTKIIKDYNKTIPKSNKAKRMYYNRLEILRKYNLTPETFTLMLDNQRGCCKICGESLIMPNDKLRAPRLNIDHSHTTKEVRGLLCYNCNRMLGHAKDDPSILKKAVKYLGGSF